MSRARDAVLGLVHLGLGLALVLVSLAAYRGHFADDVDVTLQAGAVGNALRVGSDVKFLGVPVGRVSGIEPRHGGATVAISIDRDQAAAIPRESVVRLVPESLFGERYVSILPREGGDPRVRLADGDRLEQDFSDAALQAEDLFESLLPVLNAVQPEKLNATLGELVSALRGQGRSVGDSFVRWGAYLQELRPHVPALARDLELLGQVANGYAAAAPDLLAALDDLTTTTGTLTEKRDQLDELFADTTKAADATAGWLEQNRGGVVGLSRDARAVLEVLVRHAPLFPCVTAAITQLMPRMDKALGEGTGRPGLRAEVQIVPDGGDGRGVPLLRGCPSVGGAR